MRDIWKRKKYTKKDTLSYQESKLQAKYVNIVDYFVSKQIVNNIVYFM